MPEPTYTYSTTPFRIILALVAGAATGGLLIALWYLYGTAIILGGRYTLEYGIRLSLLVFPYAFIVWMAGLIVFGLPPWWLFHRAGLRRWYVAAAVGAGATCLALVALETFLLMLQSSPSYIAGDAYGWWAVFRNSMIFGSFGILVALVVWRVAYRRVGDVPS